MAITVLLGNYLPDTNFDGIALMNSLAGRAFWDNSNTTAQASGIPNRLFFAPADSISGGIRFAVIDNLNNIIAHSGIVSIIPDDLGTWKEVELTVNSSVIAASSYRIITFLEGNLQGFQTTSSSPINRVIDSVVSSTSGGSALAINDLWPDPVFLTTNFSGLGLPWALYVAEDDLFLPFSVTNIPNMTQGILATITGTGLGGTQGTLEYSTSSGGPWTAHAVNTWSDTEITIIPNLPANGQYYWRVTTNDLEVAIEGPNSVSGVIPVESFKYTNKLIGFLPMVSVGVSIPPASAPTGLQATLVDSRSVRWHWDAMSGVSGYKIRIRKKVT